jgi:two-component sensor histidine kinase
MRGPSSLTSAKNRGHWWRIAPGSFKAYAFAMLLVAIATALRGAFGLLTGQIQAFTTFYPAVLLATLIGGAGPGILAALTSGVICWLFFLPPFTGLLPLSLGDEINLLTFLIASVVIVWATDHYRRLTKRLRDEENLRRLAVEELAHRLKNKVATIQSIVAFNLSAHPEAKNKISGALAALMATDDLITAAQGRGADIRDILSAELKPYDLSRVAMSGGDLRLPAKLALIFALLIHELATNAAKYGSLSKSIGKLSIDWTFEDGRLSLVWRETDGPLVKPPSGSGFGTRLFKRALEQFGGGLHEEFAPTGLVCKLNLTITEMETDDVTATAEKLHS